ncbi:hypothetical protein NXS19_007563 [Fusarium pseudograminearum]|nr:hypothetical protein NXS19_007563 [Fusarium pseudograminearum]
MKLALASSQLAYFFTSPRGGLFASTPTRQRGGTASRSAGRRIRKQHRRRPLLRRSTAILQDDRVLSSLSSLTMEDKKRGEAPERHRPDAEDSMEICSVEPPPDNPTCASPVAAEITSLSFLPQSIREHQEQAKRRKLQDVDMTEDTETLLPMDTS